MAKIFLLIFLIFSLTACAWLDKKETPPIPGKRISVLSNNRSIQADPSLKNVQILLPRPTPNDSWPQAGGYANHAMHHIEVRDSLEKKWSTNIGEGNDTDNRLSSEPVIGGGKVFAMDSGSAITALNFNTGNRVWHLNLTPKDEDDGHIGGGLAYDNGILYVTTGFAKVFALDAENGKLIWKKKLEAPLRAPPTVRGGRVFVITLNNQMVTLNSRTGEDLWKHSGLPETASMLGSASPAVDDGIVIAPYSSGQLVALRVDNGRVLWEESLTSVRQANAISAISDIRGRPIIDRGLVIAISNGGQIIAVNLRTGKRVWRKDIGSLESPWIAGDYIFTLTNQAEVVCLSRKNGRVHWVKSLEKYKNPEELSGLILWTGPILASDRLIIAASTGLALAVSPYSGKILGYIDMPDGVSIPPVVANGNVFFIADDAELVAYH